MRRALPPSRAPITIAVSVALLAACGARGGADSAAPTGVECPAADPADAGAITDERAALLVGLTETDAERCATDLGWEWRVGGRDGEAFAVTADWSPTRVTVTVADGTVTAIVVG